MSQKFFGSFFQKRTASFTAVYAEPTAVNPAIFAGRIRPVGRISGGLPWHPGCSIGAASQGACPAMSVSSIINNAVTGASNTATAAASTAGHAANSASAFQAMLAHMENGAGAASSTSGTASTSIDPLSALGNLTVAGANSVEQVLGNAIQQALQAYGSSTASNALPPLNV